MGSMIPCYDCYSKDGKIDYGDFPPYAYPCCNCGSNFYKEKTLEQLANRRMIMTENEALEKHKEDCGRCKDKACKYNHQCLQEKDIEVYEEIQKYRAIGTVDECRVAVERMKPGKAVEDLEKIRPYEPNVVKAAWNIFGKSYEYRMKYNEYKQMRREKEKEMSANIDGQISIDDFIN